MSIERIEGFMNRLTDSDWGWWPARSLRPAKDRDINDPLLWKMSLVYGVEAWLVSLLAQFLIFHRLSVFGRTAALPFCISGFFLLYKFTFAHFWNRRARRLRQHVSVVAAGAASADQLER